MENLTQKIAKKLNPKDVKVIFDNAGGITLQAPLFVHYYGEYSNQEKQAAEDYLNYMMCDGEALEIASWDGNQPEFEVTKEEINANPCGYQVWTLGDEVSDDDWAADFFKELEKLSHGKLSLK